MLMAQSPLPSRPSRNNGSAPRCRRSCQFVSAPAARERHAELSQHHILCNTLYVRVASRQSGFYTRRSNTNDDCRFGRPPRFEEVDDTELAPLDLNATLWG